MYKFVWISFWIGVFSMAVGAQDAQSVPWTTQSLLSSVPSCGARCMIIHSTASTCGVADLKCLCNDKVYNDQVFDCVLSNCTIRLALTCELPVENRQGLIKYFLLGCNIVVAVFLTLRLLARMPYFGGKFGLDDATILIPEIGFIGCLVILWTGNHGFGYPVWILPFKNIDVILLKFYVVEKLYIIAIWMTKVSIILFYLRIFPEKKFRRVAWAVLTLCLAAMIAFVLSSVFECTPITRSWTGWDGEHEGHCTHINAQGWANAGVNIFFDLVTIALPLPQIFRLKMSPRQKAGILLMFGLGVVVTVVSIIRLHSLVKFARSHNPTYDYVMVGIWSNAEIAVGIIIACLPGVRAFYTQVICRHWKPQTIRIGESSYGSQDTPRKWKFKMPDSWNQSFSFKSTLVSTKADEHPMGDEHNLVELPSRVSSNRS